MTKKKGAGKAAEAEAPAASMTPAEAVEASKEGWAEIMGQRPSLVSPASTSERWDVVQTQERGEVTELRLYAMALALAWRGLRRELQTVGIVYKGRPGVFGGQVQDFLMDKRGVSLEELMVWGKAAVMVITGSKLPGIELATEAEVLVGNSTDTEG